MKEREGAASPTCTAAAASLIALARVLYSIASVGEQVQLFAPNHPSRLDQRKPDEVSCLLACQQLFILMLDGDDLLGISLDRTLTTPYFRQPGCVFGKVMR